MTLFIYRAQSPDSPIWLLTKLRTNEAKNSLRLLRGWSSANYVDDEFRELQKYCEMAISCATCQKILQQCTHPRPDLQDIIYDVKRPRTIKPMLITSLAFFVIHFCGILPFRERSKHFSYSFGVDVETVEFVINHNLFDVAIIFGNIALICSVRSIGKRIAFLISLFSVVWCCVVMCK